MAKPINRETVFETCDRLLLSEGSMRSVSFRMLHKSMGGTAPRVRAYHLEWIAEREKWIAEIPPVLERLHREFVENLWLFANVKTAMRLPRGEERRPAALISRGSDLEVFFAEMDEMRQTIGQLATEVQRKPGRAPFAIPQQAGATEEEMPSIISELPFSGSYDSEDPEEGDLPDNEVSSDLIGFSDLTVEGRKKADTIDPEQQSFEIVPDILRRRTTKADWEGAENERIAKVVAAILRREGMPLRAEEFRRELLEHSPGWKPADFTGDIREACLGSKVKKIDRAMWWFEGEDVPWRRDPRSEDAKRRQKAKLVVEKMLQEIKRRDTPVSFDDLLAIAKRGSFDKEWLVRKLEALIVNYPTALRAVEEGYVWVDDARVEVVKERLEDAISPES